MPSAGPLSSAAISGKVEEVRTLLDARANIEEKSAVSDGAGTSVAEGLLVYRNVCDELLQRRGWFENQEALVGGGEGAAQGSGADAGCVPQDGDTPLHCAAAKGHQAVARVLLDAGADKEAKDKAS